MWCCAAPRRCRRISTLAVSDNHWLEGLKLRYGALECRTLNVEGELDPCTDEGVNFVNKQYDVSIRSDYFFDDRF